MGRHRLSAGLSSVHWSSAVVLRVLRDQQEVSMSREDAAACEIAPHLRGLIEQHPECAEVLRELLTGLEAGWVYDACESPRLARMAEIGQAMMTQDNRGTSIPIFTVQQRFRVYGLNPDCAEGYEWSGDDGEKVPDDLAAHLEAGAAAGLVPPDGFRRVGYMDIWEFVTATFTENAANDYIARNGHNLREPRIYVESGYRNREWDDIRAFLLEAALG
jgi:hypothetical protein